MNQKCLTTIFVPVQPLNFTVNPPSVCQKHQKPLSYYNKYKPDNDPICLDCLVEETKEGSDSNLYIPFSNLEQEYYYQKNAFFQIIEQANNMKKYDSHITNFQNLLSTYFSQFISKYLRDNILISSGGPQKKIDFYDKNNNSLNSKEIMNILNKVENEKYILENRCADIFCQIKKLQTILLKNHEKLGESFKNLLNEFFDAQSHGFSKKKETNNVGSVSNKEKAKEKIVSSKFPNTNSQKSSAEDINKTQFETKMKNDEIISPFSNGDEFLVNFDDKIKEMSNFTTNLNLNLEKEKIFEENPEFDIEDEKKSVNDNELNNSFSEINTEHKKETEKTKSEKELEWRKKSDNEELAWRRKNNDDDIYLEHKEKINKLIEQDKNKKSTTNQSFFQSKTKKSSFKKKFNLNKSFQKYNQHHKFNFPKKIIYKQYNQFSQKTCKKCSASFITTKNEEICQNCKYLTDEDDSKRNRRTRDFSNKKGKFSFFQKSYIGQKKLHKPPRLGNKKTFGKKMETPFGRHFCNKTLIHSSSNFLGLHNNNKMNSTNIFDENKKYFASKFKTNRGKDKYNRNFGKKKYNLSKNADDFEVDLDSGDENNSNDNDNDNDNHEKKEKSFFKTTGELFRNDSSKRINMDDNENSDDNKSDGMINRRELHDNDKNNDMEEDEDNDFETDF